MTCTLKTTKTVEKKWKEISTNGKTPHVHGLEDLVSLRLQYSTEQSTYSMQPLSKSQLPFFNGNWQSNSKIYMEVQRTKNNQHNAEKRRRKLEDSSKLQNLLQSYS